MRIIAFNNLNNCDLIVDAIYEGNNTGNASADPINKILRVGNQGGFRYAGNIENLKYIVLYTSGENVDWPDNIDTETGIFKYYGDNRKAGFELHDTTKKGNLILKNLFESLHASENPRQQIPPIFIFEKFITTSSSRSVQFKGLCVPGTLHNNSIDNLVAIWRTTNGLRFQNYVAYFTILNIASISREWLNELNHYQLETQNAPREFIEWKQTGKYRPLISQKTINIRSINDQLPKVNSERILLELIYKYFSAQPISFEYFAAEVYKMTDSNIIIDEITRGTADGGRDALGRLKLGLKDDPIFAEFALEAKCYNPGINGEQAHNIGVKETSRLISRIRNRQFGILVTTSAVSKQAYEEVRNDKHPIIFLTGVDIVKILIEKGINTAEVLSKYLYDNFKINARIN